MAKPLDDDERQRIVDLLQQGKSARDIAADVGRSADTVSRVARSIGHRFGRTNLTHAREARSAYSAERRATIAARATEEAEKLLEQLGRRHVAFNFGGRDNSYEEHEFDEPPVDAKLTIVRAFREAMRTVLDIDRHDNRNDEGLAAVDQWLRNIVGGAG